jgi:hypothetical protein
LFGEHRDVDIIQEGFSGFKENKRDGSIEIG